MPNRVVSFIGRFDTSDIRSGFKTIENQSRIAMNRVEREFDKATGSAQQLERATRQAMASGKDLNKIQPYMGFRQRGSGGSYYGISGTSQRFEDDDVGLKRAREMTNNIKTRGKELQEQNKLLEKEVENARQTEQLVKKYRNYNELTSAHREQIRVLRDKQAKDNTRILDRQRQEGFNLRQRQEQSLTGLRAGQAISTRRLGKTHLEQQELQAMRHYYMRQSGIPDVGSSILEEKYQLKKDQFDDVTQMGQSQKAQMARAATSSKQQTQQLKEQHSIQKRINDEASRAAKNTLDRTQEVEKSQLKGYNNARKANGEYKRAGISFGNLLGLMIKFGFAMEIIMLPHRIISGISGIVSAGVKWEEQLANINSLLNVQRSELIGLGRTLSDVSIRTGAKGDLLKAGYDIVSTMNRRLIGDAANYRQFHPKGMSDESIAVAELTNLVAESAVAGAASIEAVSEGQQRLVSSLSLDIEGARKIRNAMFHAVDIGIVTYEQLAPRIGEIGGLVSRFWGGFDQNRRLKEAESVLATYGVMSQSLNPNEAATSLRAIFSALTLREAGAEKNAKFLRQQYGVKLTTEDIVKQGWANTMEELAGNFGTKGRIVDVVMENRRQRGVTYTTDAEEISARTAIAKDLLTAVGFRNIRGIRGLDAIAKDNFASFREGQEVKPNAFDIAYERQKDSISNQLQQVRNMWDRIKIEFFLNMNDGLGVFLRNMSEGVGDLLGSEIFQNASFAEKFKMLWEASFGALQTWMKGEGKGAFEGITTTLLDILDSTLLSEKAISVYAEIGLNIGTEIVKGIGRGVIDWFNPFDKDSILRQSFLPTPPKIPKIEQRPQQIELFRQGVSIKPGSPLDKALSESPETRINYQTQESDVRKYKLPVRDTLPPSMIEDNDRGRTQLSEYNSMKNKIPHSMIEDRKEIITQLSEYNSMKNKIPFSMIEDNDRGRTQLSEYNSMKNKIPFSVIEDRKEDIVEDRNVNINVSGDTDKIIATLIEAFDNKNLKYNLIYS